MAAPMFLRRHGRSLNKLHFTSIHFRNHHKLDNPHIFFSIYINSKTRHLSCLSLSSRDVLFIQKNANKTLLLTFSVTSKHQHFLCFQKHTNILVKKKVPKVKTADWLDFCLFVEV